MRKLIEQIMKFGVVGVIAFVIDFGVMVFLTEVFGIDPVISATVSFIISVIFNYAASMRYVFSHREGMSRTRVHYLRCALRHWPRDQRPAHLGWNRPRLLRLPPREDLRNRRGHGLELRDPQDLSRGRRVIRATRGKSRLRWMRARSSLRLSRIAV